MILHLLLVLWVTATSANHDHYPLEAVPLEANGLPADKYFPELQELVRLGCPKKGQFPRLVIPENPVVGVSTYAAKYFDMLGDCSNHTLHRRDLTDLTRYSWLLGTTVNIGKTTYMYDPRAAFGPSIVQEDVTGMPQECFHSIGGAVTKADEMHARSSYEMSDLMATKVGMSVKYAAFGGSIRASVSSNQDVSKSLLYYRYDGNVISGTLHFKPSCLAKFLDPVLKRRILAMDDRQLPKNDPKHPGYKPYKAILQNYGTHYVHALHSGGSFEFTSTADKSATSSAEEFALTVKAKVFGNTGSFGMNTAHHQENKDFKYQVRARINGGGIDASVNLIEALQTGQGVDERMSDWTATLARGHGTPAALGYRPLFEDVIPYVFEGDIPRQERFLANMKQASRYVARKAWKDFCLEDMWDDKSLTCGQHQAMNFMGKWIYLLRSNRCLFFNKSKRIIQLNDHISGPCSKFRMEWDRGSVEVRGEKGILAYINGDTSNVSIIDNMYADSYAEFRFTYEGGLRVRCKGEEGSYLYAKGDFLHLGPNSENLAIADFSFSVKQVENPVPAEQEKNTPFEQAEGSLPDIRTGSTVPSEQEQEMEQKNESLQTSFKQAQETERSSLTRLTSPNQLHRESLIITHSNCVVAERRKLL